MSKRLPPDKYKHLLRTVFDRDGWKCRRCRLRERLHGHHIVFRSKGGEDTTENLITLCNDCHDGVHSRVPGARLVLLPNNGESVDANKVVAFAAVGGWRPRP